MHRVERIVPLIPPAASGPFGVSHLPRMWLKGILSAADMAWDEYFPDYRGFNKLLIDAIGLDPDAFFAYMEMLPSYPDTERWVRDHATKLDAASIGDFNTFVATFARPEEAAAAIRERVGLQDSSLRISSELINLDDWSTMHEYLVTHRYVDHEPTYPTVSSGVAGPLGIAHMPRYWMKALLGAVGALPRIRSGHFGFDNIVADMIGMDLEAASAFIRDQLPSYVQFEVWLRSHIPAVDKATRAGWNQTIRTYKKPVDAAAVDRAEAGVPELSFCEVVLLNDMVDWKHLHDRVAARARSRDAVPTQQ